jgi:hypothetical protein
MDWPSTDRHPPFGDGTFSFSDGTFSFVPPIGCARNSPERMLILLMTILVLL